MPNVRLMHRTTAIGYYHQNMVGLCQKLTDHLSDVPADAPAGPEAPSDTGTPAGGDAAQGGVEYDTD